jgi:hypothetical protein
MTDGPTYQLLMVTVVPALVGLAWLFLVQLLHPADRGSTTEAMPSPPLRGHGNLERGRFGVITLADAFDPERSALWEAQVRALELIGSGMPLAKLVQFWEPYLKGCPELYEGITFGDWLSFLQECDFVAVANQTVWLTDDGREFIHCFQGSESRSRGVAS